MLANTNMLANTSRCSTRQKSSLSYRTLLFHGNMLFQCIRRTMSEELLPKLYIWIANHGEEVCRLREGIDFIPDLVVLVPLDREALLPRLFTTYAAKEKNKCFRHGRRRHENIFYLVFRRDSICLLTVAHPSSIYTQHNSGKTGSSSFCKQFICILCEDSNQCYTCPSQRSRSPLVKARRSRFILGTDIKLLGMV